MSTIYSPLEKGFDERLNAIDRCQILLLREVMGQYGAGRLILKGGMAMRAVFGSMRLTKDIDFDRDPSLPIASLSKSFLKTLERAAANSGLKSPKASVTKATETTLRARIEGTTSTGIDARFVVEISGRSAPQKAYLRTETVTCPATYGVAPFIVQTYTNDMLAAMKIAASMSEQRSAPRDIYDLRDLLNAGANPVELLRAQEQEHLIRIRQHALAKLETIGYQLARDELFPYIPQYEREMITEDQWTDYILMVVDAIEGWCDAALHVDGESYSARQPERPT